DIGPARGPITFHVEDLPWRQPVEAFVDLRNGAIAACLEQAMTGERGVPDRRNARLAIDLVLVHREKLVDGSTRGRALGMMLRITERVEHHHAVRHRRKNRAQTVFAVETLRHPSDRAVARALPQAARENRNNAT